MSAFRKQVSRRDFIVLGGGMLGSLAALAGCGSGGDAAAKAAADSIAVADSIARADSAAAAAAATGAFPEDAAYAGFRMGVQSWCFRNFKTIDDMISMTKQLGLVHIEIAPRPTCRWKPRSPRCWRWPSASRPRGSRWMPAAWSR